MYRELSILVSLLLFTTGSMATAQTMSLAMLDGGTYTRSFDVVTNEPFTVATLLDTDGHEASAAEWVQTELIVVVPGVFRLGGVRTCQLCLDLDIPPDNGEYVFAFGACLPPAEQLEVIQVTYGDFSGVMPDDLVLTIRGLQPGDNQPSSFDGSPGFVDCDLTKFPAPMGGGDAWETGSGVVVPSGALVLNPTPPLVIGDENQPISCLKARYGQAYGVEGSP